MIGRMPDQIRRMAGVSFFFLLLLVALAGTAAARTSDLCGAAVQKVAVETGVPVAVLLAIAQTETGRSDGTEVRPWPWTLNVAGQGHWLQSRAAASAMAAAQIAQGQTSIDVGCFQINYRWHGQHFSSVDHMLDPDASAAYAARFLLRLYAETGDWSAAAGAYHSRTPQYAARYRALFDRFYAAARQSATLRSSASPRVNAFPLLRTGAGTAALGSLVPVHEWSNP